MLRDATTSLPSAQRGQFYSQALAASGGKPGYVFVPESGAPPSGITLSSSGALTGTPTGSTSTFSVRVYDSNNRSDVRTFTGPKASLLFCNTAGFHRGGFSTSAPRVLATVTYSSPASLASLTERSFTFAGSLDELDAPTRYALT